MLTIKDLHAYYGPVEALMGIDLEVPDKSIVCLIGSNGAGKTTMLKAISGMITHTGSIIWNGEQIANYKPTQITKKHIIHVPEGRQVFPVLSVEENLEIGCFNWRGFFGKNTASEEFEMVYSLFPRLAERRKQLAWSLSGGEQQMLAIGRALMGRPKLLLLDEPSMGLAPLVIEELFEKIVQINNQGLPILMVEQNAQLSLSISDYAYVINQGKIEIEGAARELLHNDDVIKAYLGNVKEQNGENE